MVQKKDEKSYPKMGPTKGYDAQNCNFFSWVGIKIARISHLPAYFWASVVKSHKELLGFGVSNTFTIFELIFARLFEILKTNIYFYLFKFINFQIHFCWNIQTKIIQKFWKFFNFPKILRPLSIHNFHV